MDSQPVALPHETSLFHHAADAKAAPLRDFSIGDLGRREEEHEIAAKGVQHQGRRQRHRHETQSDQGESLPARRHSGSFSDCRPARAACLTAR